ncbi:hypothetical protein BDP27DRAFT_1415450 [Rhodocollybia butyracea]|uniref:Uncharacterized protein n=1 Tax=Rhodocollybia butyracea TaxID=206335 RepID=A0A9P5Q5E7_9AGAR|nr:hypothetical protein BDP27DRAFT_1415450 [Rhodocollybia butyracea]
MAKLELSTETSTTSKAAIVVEISPETSQSAYLRPSASDTVAQLKKAAVEFMQAKLIEAHGNGVKLASVNSVLVYDNNTKGKLLDSDRLKSYSGPFVILTPTQPLPDTLTAHPSLEAVAAFTPSDLQPLFSSARASLKPAETTDSPTASIIEMVEKLRREVDEVRRDAAAGLRKAEEASREAEEACEEARREVEAVRHEAEAAHRKIAEKFDDLQRELEIVRGEQEDVQSWIIVRDHLYLDRIRLRHLLNRVQDAFARELHLEVPPFYKDGSITWRVWLGKQQVQTVDHGRTLLRNVQVENLRKLIASDGAMKIILELGPKDWLHGDRVAHLQISDATLIRGAIERVGDKRDRADLLLMADCVWPSLL